MKTIEKRLLGMLQHMPKGFHWDADHFGDLVVRKKWNGTHVRMPNGEWNRVAEIMTVNFAESSHPIFQATHWEEGSWGGGGGG